MVEVSFGDDENVLEIRLWWTATPLCEEKENPLNCTLSMGKFYMFIICQLSYWFKRRRRSSKNKEIQKGVEDLEQSKQEKREHGTGP